MEKEPQPDSMATVTIKPEYPPSEVYSSEPPPIFLQAYHRPQSSAVQVAKIVAVTVVLVSVILGSFLLASAYVSANASCRQLEQELELLNSAADRFQSPPLQPEALVQDENQAHAQNEVDNNETPKKTSEMNDNSIDSSDSSDSSSDSSSSESEDEENRQPIKFKLPLQLDFDDLAGALIEKNQKSRMNCVVEKKRAEQVIDHQPKTLTLPFGLNLTTDPRYEHVSGERMAIFCESGNVQRNGQGQNDEENNDDDDDDDSEQTIMIQPVMIPIPQSHFPTHMAQQMQPVPQQQQFAPMHPMEQMRPPMPVPQQTQSQLPPNPILHHIAQQIIAQKIMEAQQRAREEQMNREQQQQQQEQSEQRQIPHRFYPEAMVQRMPPLPEEILTQLNRLPNRNVIVAVSEQDSDEDSQENNENQRPQQQPMKLIPQEIHVVPQEIRVVHQEMKVAGPQQQEQQPQMVQTQRESAAEMNGRQSYARGLPVHIPVHMIQQEQQEPQAAPSEEARPHYVHPRSLRSVEALVPKSAKRMKRCSCDCAC